MPHLHKDCNKPIYYVQKWGLIGLAVVVLITLALAITG